MNRNIRLIAATAILAGSIGALAACSSSSSGHSNITYSAWTDGGNIAEVAPYKLDGLNGSIINPETVNDTKWEANVDGGSTPELTVTPAGKATVAHCKIVDAKTGKTLDEQTGTPGEPVECTASVSKSTS